MSNILSKPHPKVDSPFNGFDLSRHRSYTTPVGMLLPVFKDFANVGDKYSLNTNTFVRTEAMQTAAFLRLKFHSDWFFVPFVQLYSLYPEFYYGTDDVMSSIFDKSQFLNTSLPLANLRNFVYREAGFNSYFLKQSTGGDFTFTTDAFGIPKAWNGRRLYDMLGYGNLSQQCQVATGSNSQDVYYPLLDYLAYHKIYHSHYRLTDWFPNNPDLYNVDKYYVSLNIPEEIMYDIISTVHYRPFRKDYFTNIMPCPTFGSNYASFISSGLADFSKLRSSINPEDYNNVNRSGFSKTLFNAEQDDSVPVNYFGSLFSESGNIVANGTYEFDLSASDIRSIYALDKLLRVTAFAGGHYEDQTLAHFGVKLPKGISKEAYFLGSQSFPILINEVVATSTTAHSGENSPTGAGTVIGDIAGKAFTPNASEQQPNIKFTAPCDGIIMCIASIEVLPAYASQGVEPYNRKQEMFDFYKPELDNLGMQPMFGDFSGFNSLIPNGEQLAGWTYRFSEYKIGFDVANEGFYATSKVDWVGFKQSVLGNFSSTASSLPLEYKFYNSPQYTNNIFLKKVPFAPFSVLPNSTVTSKEWTEQGLTPNDIYESDNFLVDMDIKCFKSSKKSVHSLPKLM